MSSVNNPMPNTLAIGLGANIPSPVGTPRSTLIKARPVLEKNINIWINAFLNETTDKFSLIKSKTNFLWSPLYKTKPIGGPQKQPFFINAVLVVRGGQLSNLNPSVNAATNLLERLCKIEKDFGRDRSIPSIQWGPRSLDLDILAWGNLQVRNSNLILPHPYLMDRDFVLIPLAEAIKLGSNMPQKIPPQKDWEE